VIRTLCITGAALLLAVAGLIGLLNSSGGLRAGGATYVPPDGAVVTYFGARMAESGRPLVIGASTDAGAMRPFILAFQVQHPQTAVAYIDASGSAFLARAAAACGGGSAVPDLYLSTSTDQLVRLANDGCAQPLPQAIAAAAPAGAAWRNEVVAFTVEPAAFVYGSRLLNIQAVPRSHVELIDWLRNLQGDPGKIGTYDIEASSDGYGFTAADARQPALYGRLLESLGRAGVRTYCCSNVMVDAVDRGEILFAYNVQLSYAYAAQRADRLPGDSNSFRHDTSRGTRSGRRDRPGAFPDLRGRTRHRESATHGARYRVPASGGNGGRPVGSGIGLASVVESAGPGSAGTPHPRVAPGHTRRAAALRASACQDNDRFTGQGVPQTE